MALPKLNVPKYKLKLPSDGSFNLYLGTFNLGNAINYFTSYFI